MNRIKPAHPKTVEVARREVRKILLRSPAFAELPPDEQKEIDSRMVKVASYMADANGMLTGLPSKKLSTFARPRQADPVPPKKERLSKGPGRAEAMKQGAGPITDLVEEVDFPRFVAGLIQNVFQAIVHASVEQMRAYMELLAHVTKTVDDFQKDNISDSNARDWLSSRYPDEIGDEMEKTGGGPAKVMARLKTKGTDTKVALGKISRSVGLEKPITDLTKPEEEGRLIAAARRQMAGERQLQVATMIMMGINRIVVTDGRIKR